MTQPQGLLPTEQEIEAIAEKLWQRDYPRGGSMHKTYASTHEYDKELYRKEVRFILSAYGRTPTPPLSLSDTELMNRIYELATRIHTVESAGVGKAIFETVFMREDAKEIIDLLEGRLLSQPTNKPEGDATDRKDVAACVSPPTIGGSPAPQPEDALPAPGVMTIERSGPLSYDRTMVSEDALVERVADAIRSERLCNPLADDESVAKAAIAAIRGD